MPEIDKQIKALENKIAEQAKDLNDKILKIEDLKHLAANNEEILKTYKERVKAFEVLVEQLKHENSTYKQEVLNGRQALLKKDEQLLKAKEEQSKIPKLLKEIEHLKIELE